MSTNRPHFSIIANLFWFWRNCRDWEKSKRRRLIYEIHKEKIFLLENGFTKLEIKEICRIMRKRQCHLYRPPAIMKLERFNQP